MKNLSDKVVKGINEFRTREKAVKIVKSQSDMSISQKNDWILYIMLTDIEEANKIVEGYKNGW